MPADILLVDDSPMGLRLLEAVLRPLGQRLVQVTSGEAALQCLAEREFAVILLDLHMPGLDGLQTAAYIKDHELARYTPIIFLTGSDGSAIAKAYEHGAFDYIQKPFDARILRSKVSVFVELFQLREQLRSQLAASNALRQQLSEETEARLRAERAAVTQRRELVAESTTALASSLDYKAALTTLARLAISVLADWCLIDVVDANDGTVSRLVVAYRDAEKATTALKMGDGFPSSEHVREGLAEVLRSGKSVLHAELPESANGERVSSASALLREVDVRAAMIVPLVARGKTLGAITFVYDAESDRRYDADDLAFAEDLARRAAVAVDNAKLFEEAQRASRLRDEFLMIASHELRTPLTPLKLTIASLSRQTLSPEAVKEKLSAADRQVNRLTKLVNQLLDVSRIDAHKLPNEPERLDMATVLANAIADTTDEANRTGSELRVHVTGTAVVLADPRGLEQALANVLSNAVKYGLGKPIDVSLATNETSIVLKVEDHGIGVAADMHRRIFERFERAVSSRHYGGFGLGLWIAKQAIDDAGGTIRVESIVGEGSTFTIEIPIAR